jgi:glutamyl endopeptidase
MQSAHPWRRIAGVALAAAVLSSVTLLTVAIPAQAAPAPAQDSAAVAGITMVNGAGRQITIPRSLDAAAKSAVTAGATGRGSVPAKNKGVAPHSVIGGDDRVQEGAPLSYPWEAIAYLSTNQGQCTGFMLSRDVLVTAGHCVYEGGWVTSYRVVPGKNGNSEPFGSCSGGIADVWTTSNWITTGSPDYDYGLVKLTCDIGNTVGWFGWWYNTGETLTGNFFFVEGYPADKPFATMWWDGDTAASQTATRLFYPIDTFNGQSGSPIYHLNSTTAGLCGGWCITGIHTNGAVNNENSGTRFTPDVMSFINFWINQP